MKQKRKSAPQRPINKDSAFPGSPNIHTEQGLTKREYFAALAMQGAIGGKEVINPSLFASYCVKIADALINELEKDI